MKETMLKLLSFLKSLLNSRSDVSSKRFVGIIGFFLTLIFSYVYIIILNYQSQFVKGILVLKDIPANILTLIITILYITAGLIGLGLLDKLGGNK